MKGLQSWLGVANVKEVYRVTTALNCWPEGLWRGTNFGDKGQLLYVVARRRRTVATLDFVLAPPRETVSLAEGFDLNHITLNPWLTVTLPSCNAQQRPVSMSGGLSAGSETRCLVSMPGVFHVRPEVAESEERGVRRLIIKHSSLPFNRDWRGILGWANPSQGIALIHEFEFVSLVPPPPWPQILPAPLVVGMGSTALCSNSGNGSSFDCQAALQRLEGLWATSYSSHGEELLFCRLRAAEDPVEGRWEGPVPAVARLEARKVTGDENVPAGRVSFMAAAEGAMLGRYDGSEQVTEGLMMIRPIYAFPANGAPQVVNLAARNVAARVRGVGCINVTPKIWAPQYPPAQLVLYEGDAPCFSLLWEDAQQSWRHMMDLVPCIRRVELSGPKKIERQIQSSTPEQLGSLSATTAALGSGQRMADLVRKGSQSPVEGVGTSGGGEGCDTDEGTSAARGGRKRALEGTPDEEGSEAEGAPSSSSGPRPGGGSRRAKRPRLVWTMELNKRFLDAVMHLGISQAVPKAILALMNVEGMTRENVASHLQKYRIWLKRLAGFPPGARVAPETLQQVAEQQAHQALQFPGLTTQPAAGSASHFASTCSPFTGAIPAPETQLAASPLLTAGVGNGNAHRAGYTYPTTWLGTLPQIAPLSGVSTGRACAAAPALGLPQLGFMGMPAPAGPVFGE
ncbi:hypothetical protein WJX81_004769 [Elliptochloris bilobata]|uniref:HTH myb-type domain-containing protein n=1 Tax=Elliptochloris bilobata TaxID=381761 RepID=A0AAW1QHH2_9CHLO